MEKISCLDCGHMIVKLPVKKNVLEPLLSEFMYVKAKAQCTMGLVTKVNGAIKTFSIGNNGHYNNGKKAYPDLERCCEFFKSMDD